VADQLTFLFMPESAYGPTNNCVGIGDVLRRRGHRVVFAAEASWSGKLSALGFEEDLVDLAPPPEPGPDGRPVEQDAGQFWKDFIAETAPEYRKSTFEQLETVTAPIWQSLVDGVRYCEPQLRDIVARTGADVVIEDNVVCFPALLTGGAPFVRIVSCNPLEVKGPGVPPTFSGLPAADRSGWDTFRREYDRTHRALWTDFAAWVVDQGAPPLPDLEFIHPSDTLNLYVYPAELDYTDARPLDPTWRRLDSSVRRTDEAWQLPESLRDRPGALVYFSLGSLGGADVELMNRTLEVLGRTPHRYVVSMGPRYTEVRLADNMVGAEFLPQTTILPAVDAVITHGGNNTTTEAMHVGKPMVVLPLFWDQYDNAQRVDECGYGVRLGTYSYRDDELVAAVDRVLTDEAMRARAAAAGERIRAADGVTRAADALEAVARRHRSA
jgi:MGT family glycosyltransferase